MSVSQRLWQSNSNIDYHNARPYPSHQPPQYPNVPGSTPAMMMLKQQQIQTPPPLSAAAAAAMSRRPSAPQYATTTGATVTTAPAHHHVGRAPSASSPTAPQPPPPASIASLAPVSSPSHVYLNTLPSSPAMIPSSIPSTPALLAKELPVLAPPLPPPNYNNAPSAADIMYHSSRYRHQHSRSSSFSSSPAPSSISITPASAVPTNSANSFNTSSPSSRQHNSYVPSSYGSLGLGIITSSPSPSPAPSSALALPPGTPSRRTSLITTPSPLSITSAGPGLGFQNVPISTPMTPSSSLGLGSPPSWSPRPLPNVPTQVLASPSRPARSPARPAGAALPQIPGSPQSSPQTPHGSASQLQLHSAQFSVPPTPSRIARVLPSGMGIGMGMGMGMGHPPLSRRNSRQVSVRLSSAFVQPPTTRTNSVSASVSRTTTRAGLISANSVRRGLGLDVGEEDEGEDEDEEEEVIEVFKGGDIIGEGCIVNGELVRAVPSTNTMSTPATPMPGSTRMSTILGVGAGAKPRYEVMRKLGTGSYGFVYLVREVLSSSSSSSSTSSSMSMSMSMSMAQSTPTASAFTKPRDVFDSEGAEDMFSLGLSLDTGESAAARRRGRQDKKRYGEEFAIKVLSKKNLDEDELAIQMTEVTIHQSLQSHPNIVTLHRALETESLLILVLEYVPGEDLYYFLEQQRDRRSSLISPITPGAGGLAGLGGLGGLGLGAFGDAEGDETLVEEDSDDDDDEDERGRRRSRASNMNINPTTHASRRHRVPTSSKPDSPTSGSGSEDEGNKGTGAGTPPTPSLLSAMTPQTMLSYGRLKLIASMFAQMCDAVQACHAQGVSHRDIKPENFIVTLGKDSRSQERRVIVKLSDFGLATTEKWSADVDCGSAPYMSYECRNVVGPTYATQPADVWSLGIVLINMLYHHNLWHDTFDGDASFEAFCAQPVDFLMQRSPGMTRDVAEYLAERVFRILPTVPSDAVADDEKSSTSAEAWRKYEDEVRAGRVNAGEFGEWARSLPALFGVEPNPINIARATVGTGAGPLAANGLPISAASVLSSRPTSATSATLASSSLLSHSPHSPNCVHNQLRREHDDEDDDEDEGVVDEKTFIMNDGRVVEEDDDLGVPSSAIINQSSPSPSSQSSVSPVSPLTIPQSPRPSSPLNAEPAPSVSDPPLKIMTEDHDPACADGQELCMACLNDEEMGLGLAGSGSPVDADDFPRSTSAMKRRKRGARKNKGANSSVPPSTVASPLAHVNTLPSGLTVNLDEFAQGMEFLAREISQTTRRPSSRSRSRARAPSHLPPPPTPSLPSMASHLPSLPLDIELSSPAPHAHAPPSKKPSKWNVFSRKGERESSEQDVNLPARTASLINDLNSTYSPPPRTIASKSSSSSPYSSFDSSHSSSYSQTTSSSSIAFTPPPMSQISSGVSEASWRGRQQSPGRAPPSTVYSMRSGLQDRFDRSPASSTYSSRSNATTVQSWRTHQTPPSATSSMYHSSVPSSSASSTFTRFRNGSEVSFSTVATTAPASSVFNVGGGAGVLANKKPPAPISVSPPAPPIPYPKPAPRRPANVKQIDGVPWALDELPRQMRPLVNGQMPKGDIFGGPPQRNRGRPGPKPALDTINERPKALHVSSSSTTITPSSLQRSPMRPVSPSAESFESEGSDPHRKVQKAQINSLAKLLTSFKTTRKGE